MSETLDPVSLDAPAGALAAAVTARKVSALELTDAAIARIEARDGPINAVVVRDFDRARDAARAVDAAVARGERGALMGVPMTVKESNNVAGLPTTWGLEEAQGFRASEDSLCVQRLKAAGAVILGKTNVPVLLSDWQSFNPVYGRTANPYDLGRTPGGSSGGAAAALASGMVPLELGSDIGGSIRVPAGFCGVFGHKGTYDVIPQRGHAPPGVDGGGAPMAVVGPMARTAADVALAFEVLAGPDREMAKAFRLELPRPRGENFRDFRVLILDHHPSAPLDGVIAAALDRVAGELERQGAKVARRSDLVPDLAQAHEIYLGVLNTAMSRGGPPQPGALTAHQWMDLMDAQGGVRRRWAALFDTVDVVLAPNFGSLAYPHQTSPDQSSWTLEINGEPGSYFAQLAWPGMATLAHLPSTSTPIGLSDGGLPISLQVIGAAYEDRTTLRFSQLLETAFGGFRPPPGY